MHWVPETGCCLQDGAQRALGNTLPWGQLAFQMHVPNLDGWIDRQIDQIDQVDGQMDNKQVGRQVIDRLAGRQADIQQTSKETVGGKQLPYLVPTILLTSITALIQSTLEPKSSDWDRSSGHFCRLLYKIKKRSFYDFADFYKVPPSLTIYELRMFC